MAQPIARGAARPGAVFGPVLARALARLALALRGLVTPDRSLPIYYLNDLRTAAVDVGACARRRPRILGELLGLALPRAPPQ